MNGWMDGWMDGWMAGAREFYVRVAGQNAWAVVEKKAAVRENDDASGRRGAEDGQAGTAAGVAMYLS